MPPTELARTSVGDTAGGSTAYASGMIWDSGTAAVESEVTFRYFRPVDHGRQQIWTLPEPLTLEPQSGETLLATTDEYEAITGVEIPAGATDFEATANADGTGDDVTDSVTVEPVSEADSAVAGRGVALRIRNELNEHCVSAAPGGLRGPLLAGFRRGCLPGRCTEGFPGQPGGGVLVH